MSIGARVTFAATVTAKRVSPITSESEKRNSFYTDDEYDAMKDDAARIVRVMRMAETGADLDERRICTRGLEYFRSQAHFEQRNINRDCVVKSVLEEQERQRTAGKYCAEDISQASMTFSRWARDLAFSAGLSDASSLIAEKAQTRRSMQAQRMLQAIFTSEKQSTTTSILKKAPEDRDIGASFAADRISKKPSFQYRRISMSSIASTIQESLALESEFSRSQHLAARCH